MTDSNQENFKMTSQLQVTYTKPLHFREGFWMAWIPKIKKVKVFYDKHKNLTTDPEKGRFLKESIDEVGRHVLAIGASEQEARVKGLKALRK